MTPTGAAPSHTGRRPAIGAAAVAYALLAGVENIDFTRVPPAGAAAEDVAAYYATAPGLAFTGWIGALALAAYVVFVAGLVSLIVPECRTRWASLVLYAGGVAGPVLAMVAVALRAAVIAGAATGTPAIAATLHTLYQDVRTIAGIPIGLTLIGAGIATRWAPAPLPLWLARAGLPIGAFTILASGAAFTTTPAAGWLVFSGFAADALWVAVAGVYLLMPPGVRAGPPATAWVMFFVVALAAGVSGVMLLAAPARTASFFSWPLSPPELAAVIGASYVVAAAAYGAALRGGGPVGRWGVGQVMLGGIVALSVPILVATLDDLAVFDFGRWQAVAWVILFALFPATALGTLWSGRGTSPPGRQPRWSQVALLGGYAAMALAGAAMLWWTPGIATEWAPVSGFGGRVLAGWLVLAAAMAIAACLVSPADSGPARLLVVAQPVAWCLAGLRTPQTFAAHPVWIGYCAALAVFGLLGAHATGTTAQGASPSTVSQRTESDPTVVPAQP